MKGSQIKLLILNVEVNTQRLSVSELKNGIYLLRIIENGKEIASEKITVQH
ncbi:MAG: hypothetical protein DWP98_08655 [Bacteroidetes bacterium]|nr:MAG: hypothetical protein DWP98_08655 [Bacteroidota bacterium]MBL1146014.1 hypothetical protein [Bacteroidota bacterium]MCB0802214.1 hypothetical protein [Flavobacteriales bacterium]NOG58808.1 hypothetical protein [Bacteroidota bacterium]